MQDLDLPDVSSEINILHSFIGHAPVGINKHFTMMACLAKYNSRTGIDSSSTELWNYLSSHYDPEHLEQLHGKPPFPNHEIDFDLADDDDFRELIEKRKSESSAKESPVKTESLPEISDDNTLSGASTPVHVPQAPVKERKRKSTHSSDVSVASTAEKIHSGPSRRRDRSDSERTDKPETPKIRSRDKSEKHADEIHIKTEKSESGSGKSTPSASSSARDAKRIRGSLGGKRSRNSIGREATPTSGSKPSSSSSSSSATPSAAKKARKP